VQVTVLVPIWATSVQAFALSRGNSTAERHVDCKVEEYESEMTIGSIVYSVEHHMAVGTRRCQVA
jgi:hypothetical protein